MARSVLVLLLIVAGISARIVLPSSATAATLTSFSFGAAGDYGASSTVTADLKNLASANLNFALALGDLSYNQITPASAWCQYVQQNIGTLPFELISGNHEDGGDLSQGLIWDFASCLPNHMSNSVGTYSENYYFDYPQSSPLARFILISPGLSFGNGDTYDYNKGGAAYNWVSNAIDQARQAGIQWIIVGMHKVCLTTGGSSCDIGTDIENLLISKHVDLILQGHDHNYQRSAQLSLNSSSCTGVTPTTYNSNCVVNSGTSGQYTEGAGTIINIVGTGGIDDEYGAVYNVADSSYFPVASGTNVNPRKGFVKYTVSASAITAQFVPCTTTSNFTDSYSIVNRSPAPTPTATVPPSPTITPTVSPSPTATAPPSGFTALMSQNFDGQSTGALQTGAEANLFTQSSGSGLAVENTTADSPPNALSVGVTGGGGFQATKLYSSGYSTHTLAFNLMLGSDFALPSGDYMVLAQSNPASGTAGRVNLVDAGGILRLDYFDANGTQRYLWGRGTLVAGVWHQVSISEGLSTGTLTLSVDGTVTASGSGLNLGSNSVKSFAIGEPGASSDSAVAGHLYFDDVVSGTNDSTGSPTATPTSTSTPTPTSTTAPTISPTPTSTTVTPTPTTVTPTPTISPTPTAVTPTATAPPTPTATPNGSLVFDNFDSQPAGAVQTGGTTGLTSASGSSALAVESTIADSTPNGLSVAVSGGGSGYVISQLTAQHALTLHFNVRLGSDFVLPSNDYMVLAQLTPSGSSSTGKVDLVLAGNSLHVDYISGKSSQGYIYTSATLQPGSWHAVTLKEVVAGSSGSLSISCDGATVGSVSNVNLGTAGIARMALGNEYSPADSAIAGHMYLDDLQVTSP